MSSLLAKAAPRKIFVAVPRVDSSSTSSVPGPVRFDIKLMLIGGEVIYPSRSSHEAWQAVSIR